MLYMTALLAPHFIAICPTFSNVFDILLIDWSAVKKFKLSIKDTHIT